jgi:hypothetical protein
LTLHDVVKSLLVLPPDRQILLETELARVEAQERAPTQAAMSMRLPQELA